MQIYLPHRCFKVEKVHISHFEYDKNRSFSPHSETHRVCVGEVNNINWIEVSLCVDGIPNENDLTSIKQCASGFIEEQTEDEQIPDNSFSTIIIFIINHFLFLPPQKMVSFDINILQ